MRDIIGEFFYFYYFCRDMITSELNKVVSKVLATTSLPAATVADSLAEALRSVHAAVVVAPPGAVSRHCCHCRSSALISPAAL